MCFSHDRTNDWNMTRYEVSKISIIILITRCEYSFKRFLIDEKDLGMWLLYHTTFWLAKYSFHYLFMLVEIFNCSCRWTSTTNKKAWGNYLCALRTGPSNNSHRNSICSSIASLFEKRPIRWWESREASTSICSISLFLWTSNNKVSFKKIKIKRKDEKIKRKKKEEKKQKFG